MTHIQVQSNKNSVSYISKIHSSHTKYTVLDIFLCVWQPSTTNYSEQGFKNDLKSCDREKGWGRQTLYELLDPEQGSNDAKFERCSLNCVHKKANINRHRLSHKTHHLSPLNTYAKV